MAVNRSSQVVDPGKQCFLVIKTHPGDEYPQKHHKMLIMFVTTIRKSLRRQKKPWGSLTPNCELEVGLAVPYSLAQYHLCARSRVALDDEVASLQILAAYVVLSSYQKAKKSDLKHWKAAGAFVNPKAESSRDGSGKLAFTIPFWYVRKGIIPPNILESLTSDRSAMTIDSGIDLDYMGRKSHNALSQTGTSKSNNLDTIPGYGDFRVISQDDDDEPRYTEVGPRSGTVKSGISADGNRCLGKTKSEVFFGQDFKWPSVKRDDRYMSIGENNLVLSCRPIVSTVKQNATECANFRQGIDNKNHL